MEVPFQYGRLAEAKSFIDRVDDRRELKNFLSHGINTILVSPRRWGKSSLVKKYRLGQSQTITRNKKTLVEKDLVKKTRDTFSFVDPLFELWLKREYGIV